MIITVVFDNNDNCFAENWRKSPKNVIITSTPDEFVKNIAKDVGNVCKLKKTTQSKQSPIGLKLAQSGHSGCSLYMNNYIEKIVCY
jgi:hypothetical protein